MVELYMQYGPMVLIVIFAAISWLFMTLLWGKIKDTKYGRVMLRTGQELKAAISLVSQTYVSALKEANADGKLTDEEKKEAMALAIKKAKENIGLPGLRMLARILALESVDSWLETQAENLIVEMKGTGELPPPKP